MPTTLPVPSKGALRALRNLALGTSCTLALSAGLLTEDRRRRIHAAREVHDNAKKLKSSRKYHSTGTTAIETFEDKLLRYRDDAFWLPSNVSKSTIPRVITGGVGKDGYVGQDGSRAFTPTPLPTRRKTIARFSFWQHVETKPSQKLLGIAHLEPPRQSSHNRQHKLAADVTKLLEQPENIDEAASRFFEAFEEGLSIDDLGILQPLMDAAVRLANACEAQSKFDSSEKVFEIILGTGTIHEAHFYLFHPEAIIHRLLKRPSSDLDSLQPEKLRKASSIFLTKFKEKPKTMSTRLQSLGERLCEEGCRYKLYDLALDIYTRMESSRGDAPPRAVHHLITATHMKGHHKKVFRYFHKLYTQTTPDQLQFINVGNLTIESILKTGKMGQAEEALIAAGKMAENSNISISITWLLKVLGHEWRTRRDLERTRALFGRLEPLTLVAQRPQAFYGAMIQFCIEANDEAVALSYYETMRRSWPSVPGDVRIYGHFALAKAMRKDWLGVEDDFRQMRKASPGHEHDQEFSAVFTPVLKLYVQSHSLGETEQFIRLFVDELRIKPSGYMMNIMVDAYGNAKEIDSLDRWIRYAVAAGCRVDSVTLNIILNKCSEKWDFAFWDVFRLYQSARALGSRHSRIIDKDTVPILRRIAMSNCSSQEELARRLEILKSLDNKSGDHLDSKGVLRAMKITLAKTNPIATLKIYKRAKVDQVLLESKHLNLAVKASLQLHGGNIEETSRHVQDAQAIGLDVSPAIALIVVHQMTTMYREGNSENRQLIELAESTISALDRCGLEVPTCVVTHVASILERRGHFRLCIEFWDAMSCRLNIHPSSFDLVTLTVLLKAYIGLEDHIGVRWVIKSLSANKLRPDARFRLLLKNARRMTSTRLMSGHSSNNMYQFLDVLIEAIETTRLLREEAADDQKEVTFKTIKIMEKAIADEAVRQGSSVSSEVSQRTEVVMKTPPSKTSSIEVGESWMAEDLDEGARHELKVRPGKLVGVVAG
jgi:hypothetical protein